MPLAGSERRLAEELGAQKGQRLRTHGGDGVGNPNERDRGVPLNTTGRALRGRERNEGRDHYNPALRIRQVSPFRYVLHRFLRFLQNAASPSSAIARNDVSCVAWKE